MRRDRTSWEQERKAELRKLATKLEGHYGRPCWAPVRRRWWGRDRKGRRALEPRAAERVE